MITPEQAQERCAELIGLAVKKGADSADAVTSASASESVSVRLGALEDVERSEGEEIGLRVFLGQRSATISTSDFSDEAFAELTERVVAMARLAPEDPFAGLAPSDLLARTGHADYDLSDPAEPTPASLRDRALEMEDAARAVEGVTNSGGANAGFSRSVVALVTSHGFSGGFESTSHALSASLIAGEGDAMQRDYEYRAAHYLEDLPSPASIGLTAAERTIARMNPGKLPSGAMPVLFDPRVSGTLIGHLIAAMSGMSAARRSTFLLDRIDDTLFPASIRILDDPHRLRGPRSRPFDGEGLPTAARALVEAGKCTGWLLNSAAARQLDLPLTGHAARSGGGAPGISASNVHMEAGEISREEMIAEISDGVLVTELVGQGVNGLTGDYSRAASGFRIRSGELVGPVADFTIAGNLLDMFAALIPASDLEMYRAINAPTLRIDGMTVAGE
ncbi:TldD/PmbA family protein [Pontixanthobacter gangjinensis]|uniref:TldD/PmbA family protein n=1 Tax=Pontixanthobacter gangjinensis TaxID=1028742 RepID=A0A6I4SIL2_9SPHN|nr:metallopeptidase TldD-related protein [Pontixanthobacter gangjinensis]MXO55463.1 TldD/PmbA family protein [Pontixanthobacter gangjinensis]